MPNGSSVSREAQALFCERLTGKFHGPTLPIFQSYSVFNSVLAEVNEHHLRDGNSPDTLFFKIQAIDNRLPSLEDGLSWPAFLLYYQPQTTVNDLLVLRKKTTSVVYPLTQELSKGFYHIGQTVAVPRCNAPIYVELKLNPTFFGALANFLFKSEELSILVTLETGVKKQYRFIPKMAESGFLLSPLIESTEEFVQLYQEQAQLFSKRVSSFQIKTSGLAHFWLWDSNYEAHFKYIV